MAFETPVFLFALAAVAAPVIVHLIFRVRKRVVRFGTLRFLRALMKRNRRRLRLRDVLLLIVRAAVVALVALAFARPYFPGGAGESDGGRRDVVFVLDDSFSMSAGRMARTSFDEAKSSVLAELSGMRRGDRAALVLANGGGRTVAPLTDALETVRAGVRAAHVTHERAELAPALRAAAGLLAGSDADIRRIAVASDLQRTAWTEAGLRAVAAGGVVYDSILPPAGQPNLAVVGAEPVTEVWVPGTPVRVRARVANFGDADAGDVAIRLRAGAAGAVRAERSVNVPAGGESAIELAFDAVAPGEVPATVEIDGRDPLAADDMRYLVVSLRGRTHALAVMDEVSAGPSRIGDEDYFLRRALDPRLDDSEAPLTPFETEEIRSRTLDAASLRAADAVCLLGARKLTRGSLHLSPGEVQEQFTNCQSV